MSLLNKASLIQIPSGYKDGTLYSAKPTNGDGDFTFSRGSNLAATRVNSEGLIEKGRENLLQQSNSFSTTWGSNNVTLASGQSGYDGSSDAWLLTATGSTARLEQSVSANLNVFSIYAKAGTTDGISLRIIDGASNPFIFWNLNDGSYAGSIGGGGIDSNNQQVTNVGNGWYRIQITNASATTAMIYVSDSSANLVTSGNIYIQDAQLEQGLVATDYIETTTTTEQAGILEDMPRLDYSGGASCPSLLLEPQRTNTASQSEYLNGISSTGGSKTDNATTSPEGLQNAGVYVENTTNTYHRFNTGNQSYTQNQAYTFSVFAKSYSGNRFLIVNCSSAFGARTYFDLSDGTKNVVSGTADIQDFGNGWYRCSVTGTRSAATGTDSIYFGLNTTEADTAYTGDGTSGMYFYGAMLEEGSYATSYIPTYGASVTRGADNCEVTSASALIGQTEGTFFGEFTFKSTEITNRLFSISGANWDTIGHIRFDMINLRPQAKIRTTGADVAEVFGTEDIAIDSVVKFAVVYTSTTLKAFVNGEQVGSTDTLSGSLPSMDEIVIDALGGEFSNNSQNNQLNPYKQALVFKTALTDAECISLTTI